MAPVFCPLKKEFIIFCGGDDDDDDVGKTPPRRALWAPGDICQRRAPGRLSRGRGRAGVSGRCRRPAGVCPAGGCSPARCRAGSRIGLIEGLVTVGPPPPHLLLGEGRRVLLCSSSFLPSQGAFEGRGGGIIFVVVMVLRFKFPPPRRCLPWWAPMLWEPLERGDTVRQEGGEGLTSVATPRMGKGSASPFHLAAERLRGSATGCPPPPTPALLGAGAFSSFPASGLGGRRGKETTSGRGLAGRCRPRSPRAALSDRPENRGPIPPAAGHGVTPLGFGPAGSRRSSPAEPGNPAPRCEGQNSSGRRRGGCQPGGQLSAVSIAGRVVSRLPHALGGSGLEATAPLPWAWAAGSSLPGARLQRGRPIPCRGHRRPPWHKAIAALLRMVSPLAGGQLSGYQPRGGGGASGSWFWLATFCWALSRDRGYWGMWWEHGWAGCLFSCCGVWAEAGPVTRGHE